MDNQDTNHALVREFIAVFPRAVADDLGAFFTDDAVYHDAPTPPVLGRPAIIDRLRQVFTQVEPLPWDVRAIAISGAAVLTERVDYFRIGDRRVGGATMGTFELRAGKIAAWREYWDARTAERQVRGEAVLPNPVSEPAAHVDAHSPREATNNIALVRRFLTDVQSADADRLADYFAADAVFHDLPHESCHGRAAIRERLRSFFARSEQLPWEVRHIAASGDTVLTERVDAFRIDGQHISRPCMGTFELRNGHIAAWRDYWDLQQVERQLKSGVE